MNLFRSEESLRAWADFNVQTENTIKPVREWAALFRGVSLFERRLDDDFVEKSEEYGNAALNALGAALS
jgi:hypothetical protein